MTQGKRLQKKIKYAVLYRFIQTILWLAAHFPRPWILAFYEQLGKIAYRFFPDVKQQIQNNLKHALGTEASEINQEEFTRKLFSNLSKNVADIFISHSPPAWEKLLKNIKVEGLEYFDEAYQRGNGVIMLGPHLGAFEMVGTYLSHRGYQVNLVGRKLKNDTLDALLVKHRSRYGARTIYSQESVLTLVRALKKGEAAAVLIDQDVSWAKGVFVDFFGKPTYTPIGAAWLAQSTNTAVVPMAIHRLPNEEHQITFLPELDITKTGNTENDLQTNTQLFSKVLEKLIRQDLTQWVWMHERWKTQPEAADAVT